MDNNNSLPYGTIRSHIHQRNTLPNQILYSSPQNTLVNNNQDAISQARNFNPSSSVPRDNHRYIHAENVANLWSENGRQMVPQNQRVNVVTGIPREQVTSTRNASHNSLINNQPINISSLNSSDSNVVTRSGSVFGFNRYFHVPWSVNGITHAERPNTNSYRPLDHTSSGPSSQLPTLEEQNPSQPTSYVNNTTTSRGFSGQTSKRHLGIKRRVSREDSEDGLPRPASKLLLTEEKMAAKMHNLSISNDHSYHINGLPTHLGMVGSNTVYPSMSERDAGVNDDDDEPKEDDNNNMESGDCPAFVLAPGIKEVLSKNTELLPQSLIDQMSKPCLAVIPWKPPDEVIANISFNFNNNKTDDEKMAENENICSKNVPKNQITFGNSSIDHTEVIDNCETFEFDDDMDL